MTDKPKFDFIEVANIWSEKFEIAKPMDGFERVKGTLRYLEEELSETEDAIACLGNLIDKEDYEPHPIARTKDLLGEIVDGAGDVAFVAVNLIYKTFRGLGLDEKQAHAETQTVMARICEANMAKLHDGEVRYNQAGKVTKPEGWTAPTYDDLFFMVNDMDNIFPKVNS